MILDVNHSNFDQILKDDSPYILHFNSITHSNSYKNSREAIEQVEKDLPNIKVADVYIGDIHEKIARKSKLHALVVKNLNLSVTPAMVRFHKGEVKIGEGDTIRVGFVEAASLKQWAEAELPNEPIIKVQAASLISLDRVRAARAFITSFLSFNSSPAKPQI